MQPAEELLQEELLAGGRNEEDEDAVEEVDELDENEDFEDALREQERDPEHEDDEDEEDTPMPLDLYHRPAVEAKVAGKKVGSGLGSGI